YLVLATGEVQSVRQNSSVLRSFPGRGDSILVPPKPIDRSKRLAFMDMLGMVQGMVNVGVSSTGLPGQTNANPAVNLNMDSVYEYDANTPAVDVHQGAATNR
ncbi:MAG: hypothetical protein HRU15_07015, partial [Planctomycetes bacterium]|nr:hypothetical protein [Planctomycetota bacterium]